MKATIEVANKAEREAVKTGMADPQVRAFVLVMGTLLQLSSDRARARVLDFVQDHLQEINEKTPQPLE